MTAEQQLERSVLEGKERDELSAIAQAMSLKTNSRTKKADIIDQNSRRDRRDLRVRRCVKRGRRRWRRQRCEAISPVPLGFGLGERRLGRGR